MNYFEKWTTKKDYKFKKEGLKLNFHPLHMMLRVFAYLFSLSCRLLVDKKKSQARGADKIISDERKVLMQQRLREKLNIRVEEVRSDGGTSTTGNTVRKCFENTQVLAEILELDFELVDNLGLLLRAIRSHFPINIEEFEVMCHRTKDIIAEKYGNIPMNCSTHILLDHGVDIISNSILPTGYYSEEGPEAKNKEIRKTREMHARKDNRTHNIEDMLKRSWVTSDPVISAVNIKNPAQQKRTITEEIPEKLQKLLLIE
jgi:hypothetical protein